MFRSVQMNPFSSHVTGGKASSMYLANPLQLGKVMEAAQALPTQFGWPQSLVVYEGFARASGSHRRSAYSTGA